MRATSPQSVTSSPCTLLRGRGGRRATTTATPGGHHFPPRPAPAPPAPGFLRDPPPPLPLPGEFKGAPRFRVVTSAISSSSSWAAAGADRGGVWEAAGVVGSSIRAAMTCSIAMMGAVAAAIWSGTRASCCSRALRRCRAPCGSSGRAADGGGSLEGGQALQNLLEEFQRGSGRGSLRKVGR